MSEDSTISSPTWRQVMQAHESGLTALVVERCRKRLSFNPEDGATWTMLGMAFVNLARYADAEAALKKARVLMSGKWRRVVYWELGRLDHARGMFPSAIKWFRKGARIGPHDGIYWGMCAHSAAAIGNHRLAEKFLRKALTFTEGCPDEYWFNLGAALLAQDRWEEARECYQKAVAIDPRYGIAKLRLKDVELAIAERGQPEPKPSHPRKSRRAAARTPAKAVRARSRRR